VQTDKRNATPFTRAAWDLLLAQHEHFGAADERRASRGQQGTPPATRSSGVAYAELSATSY
jgi:hypothetical protein